MSEASVRRLRAVEAEFNAAQQALACVERSWQRHALEREFRRTTPRDLTQAVRNVEATYIIRLFAEFEGILKDHLAIKHPSVSVPARPKVDWLIRRVLRLEAVTLDPMLRLKMEAVRNSRNSIAHRTRSATPAVPLVAALSTLNTFVAKLPDPLEK